MLFTSLQHTWSGEFEDRTRCTKSKIKMVRFFTCYLLYLSTDVNPTFIAVLNLDGDW